MSLNCRSAANHCCGKSSFDRRADTSGALRSLFATLSPCDVEAEKLFETGITRTLKSQLRSPCGDDFWGGETRIGRPQYVTIDAVIVRDRYVSKLINALRLETCSVSDPHRTVLKGVNTVHIGDRLFVHAAVLPHGAVCATGRRVAVVGDARGGHVLMVGFGERLKSSDPRRFPRDDDDQVYDRDGEKAAGPARDTATAIVGDRLFLGAYLLYTARSARGLTHRLFDFG